MKMRAVTRDAICFSSLLEAALGRYFSWSYGYPVAWRSVLRSMAYNLSAFRGPFIGGHRVRYSGVRPVKWASSSTCTGDRSPWKAMRRQQEL